MPFDEDEYWGKSLKAYDEKPLIREQTQHSHRLTVYLDHLGYNTSITTDTSEPDVVIQVITDALDSYRSPRWFRRPKSWLLITGNPNMVIPLDKLLFFKIEQINPNPQPNDGDSGR